MADFVESPLIEPFPLWRGEDTTVVIKRKDSDGNYIDFSENTSVKIVFVSSNVEYVAQGVIQGHKAVIVVDDDLVVDVKSGATWRLQFTVNGRDKAPIIGKVVRKDAK